MSTLRDKIIRLAHAQPSFRAPLLGALHEAGFGAAVDPTAQKKHEETYAKLSHSVRGLIREITKRLDVHEQRMRRKPGDWGFAGDLGYVESQLNVVNDFLDKNKTASTKQAMMPVNSVSDGIEQGCMALAEDLQVFLSREYAGDMKFSKPTVHQPLTAGFEATIVNQLSEHETGYLAVNVSFRNGRELILEVFGNYPRGTTLPRKSFTLGIDVTTSQMASKYGPALVKNWIDPFLMDAQKTWDR